MSKDIICVAVVPMVYVCLLATHKYGSLVAVVAVVAVVYVDVIIELRYSVLYHTRYAGVIY